MSVIKNTTPLSASGKTNKQVEFVGLSLRYLSAQNGSFPIFIAIFALALDTLKPLMFLALTNLRLYPQLIRHHRNKLAVRRFCLGIRDRIAKQARNGIQITS